MFFFFNDTATTEIYTLSLHDALPIYSGPGGAPEPLCREGILGRVSAPRTGRAKRDHRTGRHVLEASFPQHVPADRRPGGPFHLFRPARPPDRLSPELLGLVLLEPASLVASDDRPVARVPFLAERRHAARPDIRDVAAV